MGMHYFLINNCTTLYFFSKPVHCDDIIRLEHVNTQKNLHSHKFDSPLSRDQEVSGFGANGVGDTSLYSFLLIFPISFLTTVDNWKVICDYKKEVGETWNRSLPVMFQVF